ncbi:MAG TPA: DUF2079 domain-containing protein, partial [Acidimicrobiia bacterium]|nr:DUF2079 domain-containing protein [Acidimicrobiia bacterium]
LLLVVPLYWVAPTTGTLLGIQSVAIAAGAIPVFLYARRRLEREWVALALAVVYLLHPTVSGANLEHFHPEAFLPVFVGFVLYGALEGRWRLYWVFVVLTLLVKEDVALILVPIGLWVALRRDRRIGVATMVIGTAYTLIAFLVLIPLFNGGEGTLYAGRVPFGGPGGFLRTVFTDPGAVVGHLFSGRRPLYLVQLTFPFAWVFLRRPSIAATGLAVAAINLVSVHPQQHEIRHHYSAVIVAILAMGTAYALAAIERRRPWAVATLGATALTASFLWSALPFSLDGGTFGRPEAPQAVAAREALALIPDDAVVAADHALTAHLSRRELVYFVPNPFYVSFYGTGDDPPPGTRLPITDRLEWVIMGPPTSWRLPEHVDAWEREKVAFDLVFTNEYYEVYRMAPEG